MYKTYKEMNKQINQSASHINNKQNLLLLLVK